MIASELPHTNPLQIDPLILQQYHIGLPLSDPSMIEIAALLKMKLIYSEIEEVNVGSRALELKLQQYCASESRLFLEELFKAGKITAEQRDHPNDQEFKIRNNTWKTDGQLNFNEPGDYIPFSMEPCGQLKLNEAVYMPCYLIFQNNEKSTALKEGAVLEINIQWYERTENEAGGETQPVKGSKSILETYDKKVYVSDEFRREFNHDLGNQNAALNIIFERYKSYDLSFRNILSEIQRQFPSDATDA